MENFAKFLGKLLLRSHFLVSCWLESFLRKPLDCYFRKRYFSKHLWIAISQFSGRKFKTSIVLKEDLLPFPKPNFSLETNGLNYWNPVLLTASLSWVLFNAIFAECPRQPSVQFIEISNVFLTYSVSFFPMFSSITAWKVSVFEVFWSIFSRIPTEYGPEKLRIRTLFTHCILNLTLQKLWNS